MSIAGRRYIGHGAGYLLNDNRAAGEGKEEADILLCPHCQKIIKLSQWKSADGSNGWCMHCMSPCCGSGPCGQEFHQKGCLPFLAKIEKMIQQDYARAQFRKVAGLDDGPAQTTFIYRGSPMKQE